MYFNTNYPHNDEEIQHYEDADFRQYTGRLGGAEAHIPELQLRPGAYLLTVGILPNQPTHHEFYELHYLQYPITVTGQDIPAVFFARVTVTHSPLQGDAALANSQAAPAATSDSGLVTETITPMMLQTGIAALQKYAPSLSTTAQAIVTEIYLAMRRCGDSNGR